MTDARLSRRSALQLGAAGMAVTAGPVQARPPWDGPDHLYTTDPDEVARATKAGYRVQGKPAWVFPESTFYRGNRTIRLHRLYHRGRGDRLCTTGAAEAQLAVQQQGYRDESRLSPMWACVVTDPVQAPAGTAQLLRLFKPRTNDHLHTISPEEADAAIRLRGYRLEPEYPAPYVLTAPDPAAVRLYRLSRARWI